MAIENQETQYHAIELATKNILDGLYRKLFSKDYTLDIDHNQAEDKIKQILSGEELPEETEQDEDTETITQKDIEQVKDYTQDENTPEDTIEL